jgi:hypothetical protein
MGTCNFCSRKQNNNYNQVENYKKNLILQREIRLKSSIKLQAIFRGTVFRKRFRIIKYRENTMKSITESLSLPILTIVTINKLPQPKHQLKQLFKDYKPLNFKEILAVEKIMEYNSVYYGECSIKSHEKLGRGIKIWMNGKRYEGYWMNGLPAVRGKFNYKNGDYYQGEILNCKPHGYGIEIFADGRKYEMSHRLTAIGHYFVGWFSNGKKIGFGKEKWPDAEIYKGQFYNNKRHGKGY